jgi:glutamyl-tRNA(Gln) amidotransferase subunit E
VDSINFKKLGLKAGLEIHQQLDTTHKLFCNSSAAMKEKEVAEIVRRKQHPVASELGEMDIATQHEFLRDRTFYYQVFPKETCLIELDEEPPRGVNEEALRIAIEIALMLNCEIPNEIHVMRKTITDGSNTSAFQRTMVVGMSGFLRYHGKKIPIDYINLEEDAAAIVGEENGDVTYRLNRLGVPLVEVGTGILTGFSPEEIQDMAFHIGMIFRSTGKVKRGIGTIRQDVNISIKGGARAELKGFQELGTMTKIIENDVRRQLSLMEIKNEVRKRGVRNITSKPVDVNEILKDTKSKILRSIIDGEGTVFAIKLSGFDAMLKKEIYPGKTLGRDLADFVSSFGIKGIIHSDEDLMKYQVFEDFIKLKEFLRTGKEDAIVLIGEFKDKGKVAKLLIERCNKILIGIEKEVRGVTEDGGSKYNRPLPGEHRLYPETDVIPITLTKEFITKIKKELPEPWTKKLVKFKKMKLSDDLAKQILRSEYMEMFENIVKARRVDPKIIANFFVSTLKDLEKREGVKVENLTEKNYLDIFDSLQKKKIVKEALPQITKYLATNPHVKVKDVIEKLELKAINLKELKNIVEEIAPKPNLNFEKALGLVMSKVRGRADVEVVMKLVKKYKK